MRRTFILALALASLVVIVVVLTFAFSKYRINNQGFLTSLSDFIFMIDSYVQMAFELPLQPLGDQDLETAIERLRPTAHSEVKQRVVWWCGQWGEAAAPRLVQEFEHADDRRTEWLARCLGATRSPRAVVPLSRHLENRSQSKDLPAWRELKAIADALAQIGTEEAAQALIAFHRQMCQQCSEVLEAIAKIRTRASTDYVLETFGQSPFEQARAYTWALALTRDERGARALAQLLRHPRFDTRVSARSAAGQTMGREALAPFLDAFLAGPDDYVRYDALEVLSDVVDREPYARLSTTLLSLLDHPTFSDRALDILLRMKAPEVIAVLRDAEDLDPDQIALLGAAAKPIIEERLASSDPQTRADTVWLLRRLYLPREKEVIVWARRFHYQNPDIQWARLLIEARLQDPDVRVRRAAQENLPRLDRAILLASFAESMPERFGREAWYNAGPPHGEGFKTLFHVLTGVHVVGLVFSFILGLRLLFNGLRIFEPYRFNLFIQFLLVEGFVGDFFFLLDHRFSYLAATATHLLLLIGFLSKESERLPNQTRNRFERLGGASLWVLAPLVLYLSTPLLAEGLRLVFRSFANLLPHLIALALLSALAFEQALWSNDLFRRPAWLERMLSLVLSAAVLALPIQALLRVNATRTAAGNTNGAALALFLILPLIWTLLLHLIHSRIHETLLSSRRIVTPPGKRMQVSVDGKTVTVLLLARTSRKFRLLRGVCKTLFIGSVGLAAAFVAGRADKADAMVLALISGFIGSAMAGLFLQWFRRRVLFQVREGYARTVETTFGGVRRGAAPWQRHPLFPAHAMALLSRQRLDPSDNATQPLSHAELRWVTSILTGGDGARESAQAVRPDTFRLSVRRPTRLPKHVDFLPVEMQLENRSKTPMIVGALENSRVGRTWRAEIDGDPAELFLSGKERERLVAPGRTVVCHGKIFPGKEVRGKERVMIQLGCGEIRGEPFWYPLTARGEHG
ncbi:MAG: HEAT repeat domain-containing protein [Candidatus Binatia bacterium]